MKIERANGAPIVIGKRVVLGQVVLSVFNVAAGLHDWANPDNPVPAALIGFAAQAVTGILQIVLVNYFNASITTRDN